MIGLDTNVLVRFLMQDDPEQGAAATALMSALTETAPGFVCREVLVELVWVLERGHRLPRATVARALDGLLESRDLVVEAADRVALATDRYRKGGAGFADQMIALAGLAAGCVEIATFDRKAAHLPGMSVVGAASDP